MKVTLEFHASELNAAMLAALNTLLVEDKREELRACGGEDVAADEPEILTASEMAARADAADARVVGDWAAPVCPDLGVNPIRRQDVVLQIGDKVTFRTGETGVVTEINEGMTQPVWAYIGDSRASCFTADGFYWHSKQKSDSDIVTINTRPIIEDI